MRNKAALTLIELSVMLAVFALAAALCLRGFVWAEETARACEARDQALLQAQSAAEVLKSCGSDMEKAAAIFGGTCAAGIWSVSYNEQWEQVEGSGTYRLTAETRESGSPLLGMAAVRVLQDGNCLVQLETAWQEVRGDG